MSKILIAGAGGAPSEGVINSLLMAKIDVIGMGCEPTDLYLSSAPQKFLVPRADHQDYKSRLLEVLATSKPDLVHFQNDLEIFHASQMRDDIHALGIKTFMPSHEVIDTCVHKFKTWKKFNSAGITVPKNILINTPADLQMAFDTLGNAEGKIWLRSASIGGGGTGALPTASYEFGRHWIEHFQGWGNFVAAQLLTPRTVTWQSIWYEGELIVAQGRERKGWTHGNRAISGVTGVTKVGVTVSDAALDEVAKASIYAVDTKPHGIYGVDFAYDAQGVPNPTEINISRFFTTILFFSKAGLNMPEIFVNLGLFGKKPVLERRSGLLPDGLIWMRGMDCLPRLATNEELIQSLHI